MPSVYRTLSSNTRTGIVQIDEEERQEVERLEAFYEPYQEKLDQLDADIAVIKCRLSTAATKSERSKISKQVDKLEAQRKRPAAKLEERNQKIAQASARPKTTVSRWSPRVMSSCRFMPIQMS